MKLESLQQSLMKKIAKHNNEISNLTALYIVVTKVIEAGGEKEDSDSDTSNDSDTSDACSLNSCDIERVD